MAKAIRPVKRTASTRKPRAPFKLNAQARVVLRAHAELQQADAAAHASVLADGEDNPNSPKTERLLKLRDRKRETAEKVSRAVMKELDIAQSTRRATLSGILAIALAAYHTGSNVTLIEAIYSASGIDMCDAA